MKRNVTAVLVTGALLASGSAFAKDYGDAGTIELGGNLQFLSSTTKLEDDEGVLTSKTDRTATDMQIGPSISYYLAGGLPIIADIGIGMESSKDNEDDSTEDTQTIRFAVGSGYFLKIGAARIGPAALIGYRSETTKTKDDDGAGGTVESETTYTGQELVAGGVAKLPIGGGGVITAALFLQYGMGEEEIKDAPGDPTEVTTVGFGTSIGVSVWF